MQTIEKRSGGRVAMECVECGEMFTVPGSCDLFDVRCPMCNWVDVEVR